MQSAWGAIWKTDPPCREVISIASGFPGPGTRDGFEMVTRAVTRSAYDILADAKPGPLIAEAAKGAYFFRMSDHKNIVELALKPGILPGEFIPQRRKLARGEASSEEAARFRALQFSFSDHLRSLAPLDAVNIIDIRPAQ